MSEIQPSQNDVENTRPVGRFLLGLDRYEGRHDIPTYASRFAAEYHDVLNQSWQASRVSVEEIDKQRVELEFVVDPANGDYAWRIATGSEQYEIHTGDNETYGTYYEFTPQRAVLVQRHIASVADLNALQGIVEYMTGTLDFHKNTSKIRGDKTRTHATIDELVKEGTRTHSESKNLKALRSHLFLAGFPVGSRDVSGYVPLSGGSQ